MPLNQKARFRNLFIPVVFSISWNSLDLLLVPFSIDIVSIVLFINVRVQIRRLCRSRFCLLSFFFALCCVRPPWLARKHSYSISNCFLRNAASLCFRTCVSCTIMFLCPLCACFSWYFQYHSKFLVVSYHCSYSNDRCRAFAVCVQDFTGQRKQIVFWTMWNCDFGDQYIMKHVSVCTSKDCTVSKIICSIEIRSGKRFIPLQPYDLFDQNVAGAHRLT